MMFLLLIFLIIGMSLLRLKRKYESSLGGVSGGTGGMVGTEKPREEIQAPDILEGEKFETGSPFKEEGA